MANQIPPAPGRRIPELRNALRVGRLDTASALAGSASPNPNAWMGEAIAATPVEIARPEDIRDDDTGEHFPGYGEFTREQLEQSLDDEESLRPEPKPSLPPLTPAYRARLEDEYRRGPAHLRNQHEDYKAKVRRMAAGASPAAPAASPSMPESGTLPGEEQVTTRDVFARLPPAQRSALQERHAASGSAESFDDYLSGTFGELPPPERAAEMARAAGPVGLTPQQRQDRRDVTHNFLIPEIPMMEGKGTFVRNPDGSRSMRAPDPKLLAKANDFTMDELWTPAFNAVLGAAYGIDVNHPRYSNNPDKLRDDVLRLHAEHERTGAVSRVEDTGAKLAGRFAAPRVTGNLRYARDPNKAAAVQAERDNARTPEDRARMASDIRARYAGWKDMPPGALERIQSAEMKADGGFAELRQINAELSKAKREQIAGVLRSRRNNENLANDLRNPRLAPGMMIRSLQDEANRNNPLAMAVQYEIAGMPEQAAQMRQIAMAQQQGATQMAVAEQQGNTQMAMLGQQLAAANQDPTLAGQFAAQRRAIFEQAQTPGERLAMMQDVLTRQQTREGAPPPDSNAIAAQAKRMVAEHMVRTNPQDPSVQDYLQDLSQRGRKDEFISFLTSPPLSVPLPDAERRWSAAGGWGFAGIGRRLEGGVNAAGRYMGGTPGGQQAGR